MSIVTRGQLRQLLLHRLTEHDARRLEELMTQDAYVVEMLRREEANLVDDYAFGRLSVTEQEAFDVHLLPDPAIRERVRSARSSRADPAEMQHEPWMRGLARGAAGLVACLLAIPLFILANREPAAAPSMAPEPPDQPQAAAEDRAESPTDIVLLADLQRAGDARVVRVATGAAEIHLQAEATSADSSVFYGLTVEDESGARIFSAEDLRPIEHGGHGFVEVSIPGAKLGTGLRIVTLQPQAPGIESFMWQADVQPAN